MGILYETIQRPNLWHYEPEYSQDGTEKHICCDGARFHVISYSTDGARCSEPKCELNKMPNDEFSGLSAGTNG